MINLIVYSKDRACQLHALLASVEQFAPETFDVDVVFAYSENKFAQAYEKVKHRFSTAVFHNDNGDLRGKSLELFSNTSYRLLAISTDDTILYRPVPVRGLALENLLTPDIVTFSLRLGTNTLVQDCHAGTYQSPLNHFSEDEYTLVWPFAQYYEHHNYGYPFGLDGHIFDRELFLKLSQTFEWRTTNQLESGLFYLKNRVPQLMRSFKQSVAVNVPVNNLSGVTRAGEKYPSDIHSINGMYLSGYTIDLDKLCNHSIVGCHQELPLEFI